MPKRNKAFRIFIEHVNSTMINSTNIYLPPKIPNNQMKNEANTIERNIFNCDILVNCRPLQK